MKESNTSSHNHQTLHDQQQYVISCGYQFNTYTNKQGNTVHVVCDPLDGADGFYLEANWEHDIVTQAYEFVVTS